MKYNKMVSLVILILFIITNSLYASTKSAAFLKINPSARTVGMGGVATAIDTDVTTIETNPAGLAWIDSFQLIAAHNAWFEGIKSEYLAYGAPISDDILVGLSVKYLYIDDLIRRDDTGTKLGDFGANDSVVTASFAKVFVNNVSLGCNIKFIRQEIDGHEGTAFAGDVGFVYIGSVFNYGAYIRNIGDKLKVYKEAFELPLTYCVGVSYCLPDYLNVGLDIEKEDDSGIVVKLGGEYYIVKQFCVRAGYNHTDEEFETAGVAVGFGVRLTNTFEFDYAYVPYGDLGDTHRISLKYAFSPIKKKY